MPKPSKRTFQAARNLLVSWYRGVKDNERLTGWEGHHLIPLRRQVRIRQRPQHFRIKQRIQPLQRLRVALLPCLLLAALHVKLNLPHAHGRHVVGVPLVRGLDLDLFRLALPVVPAAQVLHLREHLDHGRQGERRHGLGVVGCEAVGEGGRVGEVVGLVLDVDVAEGRVGEGVVEED